jgi:small basic protein
MVQVFGILSVLLMLIAMYFFVRQIRQGNSTPNITTWLIGLIVSLVNSLTFYKVVENNLWKGSIMFASLLTVIVICGYSVIKGRFAKPKIFDIVIFIVTIFVGVIWRFTSDHWANFLVQLIILVASFPTMRGLWYGYLKEHYLAWLLAVCGYFCVIVSISIDFQGDWLQLLGPVLNGVLVNTTIMLLSFKKTN